MPHPPPPLPLHKSLRLQEIKSPHTLRNHTIEAACEDVNFPSTIINGVPNLNTDDKQGYFAQIPAGTTCSQRLALVWLCNWYLSGLYSLFVERINFDATYWKDTLLPKLTLFYFKHCISFLCKGRATIVDSRNYHATTPTVTVVSDSTTSFWNWVPLTLPWSCR